ncbi:MAG: putative manganese-dependent inorganic diphosphatase [Clostridia bacterium]
MKQKEKQEIFVIGHKNPDTDSICSAIGYANLKNKVNKDENVIYIPKRAGNVNAETEYVLNYFKVDAPEYLEDVRTQVKDIQLNKIPGANENISLKQAWQRMRTEKMNTLPIMHGKKIAGVITVGDIANSGMDVYDDEIIAKAKTPYQNIVDTLDGKVILENGKNIFSEGKVLIGAANIEVMCGYIEKGDMAILGDREESQICAIERGASIIIVCNDAKISEKVKELAKKSECAIITSPHGTYTAARLINHSMPARYFMTTEGLVKFTNNDFLDEIKETMGKMRFHAFPVINDDDGKYEGMISRRDLMNFKRKKLILVDHNEEKQAVNGISDSEILEILDHHNIGSIKTFSPVYFRNQPVGCTATIIYQMYHEEGIKMDKTIAGLLTSAILSDTLMFRSPTCTLFDKLAATEMAKIAGINMEEHAKSMFTAGSNLKGKTTQEIFYQDYKRFSEGDINFGVGQISSMNEDELASLKEQVIPYMEQVHKKQGIDMIFFMLTNILTEATELLVYGNGAKKLIEEAFDVIAGHDSAILPGVVSRKKQLIPNIMATIQQ